MRLSLVGASILVIAFSATTIAQVKKEENAKEHHRGTDVRPLLTRISVLDLLGYAGVRQELKVTTEQEARRKECEDKLSRFVQESRQTVKQLGDDADPQARAVLRGQQAEARRNLEQEIEASLLRSLDRQQRSRLDQIGIQKEGPFLFLRPDIQQLLNMDEGQIEAIGIVATRGFEEITQARTAAAEKSRTATTSLPPMQTKGTVKIDPKRLQELKTARQKSIDGVFKVRESVQREVTKLLRKKQKEAYQKLCGEPFDLASMEKTHLLSNPKAQPKAQ